MNVLRRLPPYLRPYLRPIILALVCLLLATPCQLFHPLVWKFIVDTVIAQHKPQWLLPALVVMLLVHLTGGGLSAIRTYLLGRVGQRFIFDLRNDIYRKLQRQSLGYFHTRRSGDLISRAMNDVDALEQVVIHGIDETIASGLSFLCVAVIIVSLQWVVGTITLVPLSVVGLLVWRFNVRIKGLYRAIRQRLGDLTAKLQENLAGMVVIKAFARDAHEVQRFRAENQGYLDRSLQAVRARSLYFPSVMGVGFISNIIMIGLGGYFVLRGDFSVGGLVAYRGYWWQLFSPVQTLAQINEMFQRAIAAATRIFELLDEPEAISDPPSALDLPRTHGPVTFENVSFAYDHNNAALQAVHFQVDPGQTIGIVGPSGSGKTTLLHLLLRFYDPTQGRITLDGYDLRSVSQTSLRQQFAIVTQEAFLFHDTIRNNLRYGQLGASDAQVELAAQQAHAHDFIQTLPKGYDTTVGERGVTLSGGQRQRLCIARAFIADPAILLLDEATAAVEPESEILIQSALQRLMKGRTTIIVSHRLSMVRDADVILVLNRGRLIERGTHQQLMALDGWYARMYRLQMGEGL